MSRQIKIKFPLRVASILVLLMLLGSVIVPVLLPGIEPHIQIPQVETSPGPGMEQVLIGGTVNPLDSAATEYNHLGGG